VLVRLARVSPDRLRDIIERAWQRQAPRKLLEARGNRATAPPRSARPASSPGAGPPPAPRRGRRSGRRRP
jgi:hypothetical protein